MSENSKGSEVQTQVDTGKYVRFYYSLVIDYVIPRRPPIMKCSDDEWNNDFCERIAADIDRKLHPNYDLVVFKSCEKQLQESATWKINFDISRLHYFSDLDIFEPRKNYSGFKIKSRPLSKVKKEILQDLIDALCSEYNIVDLTLRFVTSRTFLITMYFSGYAMVEHIFTTNEIQDSGSVKEAIEQFEYDMCSAFDSYFELISTNVMRRRANNLYKFELYVSRPFPLSENDFYGDMTRIDSINGEEVDSEVEIDNKREVLRSCISNLKYELAAYIDEVCLPVGSEIVRFDVHYFDQSDDYSWYENLIS